MIVDTSYLIDLFDGQQEAFEKGLTLSESGEVQRVPSPVITELSYGAAFGDEEEKRSVQNALRMYPVVEQTEEIAYRAGELLAKADIAADGECGVGKVDSMVAAVADLYAEPVLTADIDDFRVLGVETEAY